MIRNNKPATRDTTPENKHNTPFFNLLKWTTLSELTYNNVETFQTITIIKVTMTNI